MYRISELFVFWSGGNTIKSKEIPVIVFSLSLLKNQLCLTLQPKGDPSTTTAFNNR